MKNKGLIIVVVLVVVAIVAYFLMKKKPGENVSTTLTSESTTGVAALFNTGAMSALFGKATGGGGSTAGITFGEPNPTATTTAGTPRN